jgi:hypothetical protein
MRKSQIQALDRTQPGLPIKPGKAGTMTSYRLAGGRPRADRQAGTGNAGVR